MRRQSFRDAHRPSGGARRAPPVSSAPRWPKRQAEARLESRRRRAPSAAGAASGPRPRLRRFSCAGERPPPDAAVAPTPSRREDGQGGGRGGSKAEASGQGGGEAANAERGGGERSWRRGEAARASRQCGQGARWASKADNGASREMLRADRGAPWEAERRCAGAEERGGGGRQASRRSAEQRAARAGERHRCARTALAGARTGGAGRDAALERPHALRAEAPPPRPRRRQSSRRRASTASSPRAWSDVRHRQHGGGARQLNRKVAAALSRSAPKAGRRWPQAARARAGV